MVTISKVVSLISTLLAILLVLQFEEGKSFNFDLVNVYVTNNITNYQLGVHCKDKNHDKGFQSLKYGETYTFAFYPDFPFPTSLYFCGFTWSNIHHHFDIYVQKRDVNDCGNDCRWIVNESGPCDVSDGVKCFPWNPEVVGYERILGHTPNV